MLSMNNVTHWPNLQRRACVCLHDCLASPSSVVRELLLLTGRQEHVSSWMGRSADLDHWLMREAHSRCPLQMAQDRALLMAIAQPRQGRVVLPASSCLHCWEQSPSILAFH